MELNFGLYLSEAAKPLLCDLDYSLKEMVHVVVLFIPNFIIVILGCNETGSIFLVDRGGIHSSQQVTGIGVPRRVEDSTGR